MDYIKINNNRIPYPNGFTMRQSPNIINEVTLMNGDVQADINGWKYEDQTLSWDYLEEKYLNLLLSETDPMFGLFNLSFNEPGSDNYKTIKALRRGRVVTKTRHKRDGKIVWKDIQLDLSFPEAYGV